MGDEAKQPPIGAPGEIAVIFVSRRTARDADGFGITVSYWADEAAALAWRRHAEHSRIRDAGRDGWYEGYEIAVARIERAYRRDAR